MFVADQIHARLENPTIGKQDGQHVEIERNGNQKGSKTYNNNVDIKKEQAVWLDEKDEKEQAMQKEAI